MEKKKKRGQGDALITSTDREGKLAQVKKSLRLISLSISLDLEEVYDL